MTKVPKVQIDELTFEDSHYVSGDCKWKAETLYRHAKKTGAKEFDYPLVAFDQSDKAFRLDHMKDFIFQLKRVQNADYNIPIILDDYGQVADGNHRICKAILDGKETIKAIRLNSMPEPDYIIKD